jgi:hypothetical protein
MGKLSRTKGRQGQTEFSNMLKDRDYNVVDTSAGMTVEDCLAIDVDGIMWACEVKKTALITPAHLKQAMDQAKARKARWMLANHLAGTSSWLVRRQGMLPVVWHKKES